MTPCASNSPYPIQDTDDPMCKQQPYPIQDTNAPCASNSPSPYKVLMTPCASNSPTPYKLLMTPCASNSPTSYKLLTTPCASNSPTPCVLWCCDGPCTAAQCLGSMYIKHFPKTQSLNPHFCSYFHNTAPCLEEHCLLAAVRAGVVAKKTQTCLLIATSQFVM